jgi:hypothetical protein
MIFYAIYKKQPKGFTIGVNLLQLGPWEVFLLCNVVPGGRAAAVRPNSDQPPAGAGRARAGEGPWVARARFLGSVGARISREGGHAGDPGRWPRRSLFRRGCGLGKERGGLGSNCSCEVRWMRDWFGAAAGRAPSSPRLPLMAPAAAQDVDGGRRRSWLGGASFIAARRPLLRRVEKGGPGTGSAWGGARASQTGRPTGRDRLSVQCLSGRAAWGGGGETSRPPWDARGFGNEPREGARGLGRWGERVPARATRRDVALWRRKSFSVPLFELTFLQIFV